MYIGKHKYSLEGKGRVFIPVRYRRGLDPEAEDTFVATKLYDRCIRIYPLNEWHRVEEKLKEYPQGEERNRRLVRRICASAESVKLDSQGRINIPRHLLEHAALEKEVIIIGVLNRIELWSPELYSKEESESDRLNLDSFPDLNI
jgi:MraZ protein